MQAVIPAKAGIQDRSNAFLDPRLHGDDGTNQKKGQVLREKGTKVNLKAPLFLVPALIRYCSVSVESLQ
jgi:hypothetical protein